MVFPYIKEDLISEWSFRRLCEKNWYKISNDNLKYLDSNSLLSPIERSKYSSKYSKFQFYILKFIKDYRYNIEWFITTYHNYSQDKHDKLIKFFDDHIKDFDKSFINQYQEKYIFFFYTYYKVLKYCISCGNYTHKEIKNISYDDKDYKNKIINRTFIIKVQKDYWIKSPLKLSEYEIESIKWFMTIYLNKYKEHFEIFITTPWASKKYKKIPDFCIVNDFLEIFNTIEIFENISGINLKDIRLNRLSNTWSYAQCVSCWLFYIKKRINQLTCNTVCSKKHKNDYKKEMRKKDPEYWK